MFMSEPASETVTNLVRKSLPKPIVGKRWRVRVVDHFNDAGAELYAGVVYVHNSWLESVYKAGLSHVTMHCPLAVQPFAEVDDVEGMLLLPDLGLATVCRAITIGHTFSRGLFSGVLTVGEAHIARSYDGQLIADRSRIAVIKKVLKAIRSKAGRLQYEARQLVKLRNAALELVTNTGSGRPYDFAQLVPLVPYERLLPPGPLEVLRAYHKKQIYPPEGLPFPVIRQQCVDAIPNMERSGILSLIVQLAFDISQLQASFEKRPLAEEDSTALATLMGTAVVL